MSKNETNGEGDVIKKQTADAAETEAMKESVEEKSKLERAEI